MVVTWEKGEEGNEEGKKMEREWKRQGRKLKLKPEWAKLQKGEEDMGGQVEGEDERAEGK